MYIYVWIYIFFSRLLQIGADGVPWFALLLDLGTPVQNLDLSDNRLSGMKQYRRINISQSSNIDGSTRTVN